MLIPRTQIQGLLQAYGKNDKSTVNKTNSVRAAVSPDALRISGESKLKQRAMQAAKQSPDVRTDKIDALKARISAGTYTVSNDEVAERIIEQAILDRFI